MKGYTQGFRFRSQTDEQLAAKHDRHPWRCEGGHQEKSYRCRAIAREDHIKVFDPRVECIPSPDPYPFRRSDGAQCSIYGVEAWGDRFDFEWAPRPLGSFDVRRDITGARPPVNPILVAFREGTHIEFTARLADWLDQINHREPLILASYNPAQIDHARKVLTRLAALS